MEPEETHLALQQDMKGHEAIERFTQIINTKPKPHELQKTPDGRADTMGISFVETKLDEVYLRQWGTEDVQIMQIANEVLVWLTLWVIDPQTKNKITRSGFAAVQIMVDAAPDNVKSDYKAKNAWALDMQNKKPNAMYLAFPKAKSLAIKNAAQTLGKSFGRDLNRKHEDAPEEFYSNLLNNDEDFQNAKDAMLNAKTTEEFKIIWEMFENLREEPRFQKEYQYYHRKNLKK